MYYPCFFPYRIRSYIHRSYNLFLEPTVQSCLHDLVSQDLHLFIHDVVKNNTQIMKIKF